MTSIVTKTGDSGTTGLLGGSRVSKASPRLHAYGTVDELNAILGLVLTEKDLPPAIRTHLNSLQHILFRLGADLATAASLPTKHIDAEDIALLDKWIAAIECPLPPLQYFIVPGGCRAASLLHLARTVCRRAERWAIALAEKETVNPQTHIFLNRLSDHLFLAARTVNSAKGEQERRIDYTQ
ncbi:cob(I)yrinic acid a,c-diamide adenosyltransferase [Candidatus Peregrinibacteria bacterium]|nr:cob(I)yrinic acid a,c-diamide adenosyltransferase [Candidatus Peregrinibacteria bacterium]